MTDRILQRWSEPFPEGGGGRRFRGLPQAPGATRQSGTPRDAAAELQPICSRCIRVSQRWIVRTAASAALLAKQTYNPRRAAGVRYAATFGICHFASVRILIEDVAEIDLDDLNGVMWNQYKVAGYSTLWLSRVDGHPLGRRELDRLEAAVENDFRFDNSEDELALTFLPKSHYLKVDVVELDEDDA